jgi:hypothetical protein
LERQSPLLLVQEEQADHIAVRLFLEILEGTLFSGQLLHPAAGMVEVKIIPIRAAMVALVAVVMDMVYQAAQRLAAQVHLAKEILAVLEAQD